MNRDNVEPLAAIPDPSAETVPIGPRQFDRLDDNLHYGWSWHRHQYVFRKPDPLRILDVGCGTGLSTLTLARLNLGAQVLGIDPSSRALEVAGERQAVVPSLHVAFRQHDLDAPLPGDLGAFDFVVCRDLPTRAAEPVQFLERLRAVLDPRGLLLFSFAGRGIRHGARQIQRAVAAICGPDAKLSERAEVAMALFQALRPDHPFRALEQLATGQDLPGRDRIIHAYLGPTNMTNWEIEDGITALTAASLKFLYSPSKLPWRSDRVFHGSQPPAILKERIANLNPAARTQLIDAIDPSAELVEQRIYCCHKDFEPHAPGWPEDRSESAMDNLVPHRTDLVLSASPAPGQTPSLFRIVTGQLVQLDPASAAVVAAIDGRKPCGVIDSEIQARLKQKENPEARRERWLELANRGVVLIESPNPRQNHDCKHLGPVRDRLDCPCPRKWIRACELHGHCTLEAVPHDDPSRGAFDQALRNRQIEQIATCSTCADYEQEPEIVAKGT